MGDVDIRPDLAGEGGGLVDDFDGTIADLRFVMTDYDGNVPDPVPVGRIAFDIDGEESVQLYSVGGNADFAPDETGRGLKKLKSKAALTKTCKYIMFVDSLVQSGFPLNRLDPKDCSSVIGTVGHFLRKAVEFKGLKRKKDDRDSTVLLCTKIISLPGEDGGKGKAKGKSKSAAPDDTLADAVAGIIQGVIIENDGEVAKKNLLSALFKSEDVKALDDKKGALKLASDDTFLKSRDEWTYEEGMLKME
uniref:Uncharacterized protein n=1 Tax=viral metagenome TaxID=1070528 RepID=A0A6M3JT52_9ZZZZ